MTYIDVIVLEPANALVLGDSHIDMPQYSKE